MKGVSLYNFKLFPLIIICSNGVLTTVTMNKISNLFAFPYTIGSASIMHKLVEEEDSVNFSTIWQNVKQWTIPTLLKCSEFRQTSVSQRKEVEACVKP